MRITPLSAVDSTIQTPVSPTPVTLSQSRSQALEQFSGAALPSEAEELWRYSRIDELDLGKFAATSTVDDQVRVHLPPEAVAAGVTVVRGDEALASGLFGSLLPNELDALTLLAVAKADDVVLIDVPSGVTVNSPVLLTRHFTSNGATIASRLFVRAGANSEITIIETINSDAVASLSLPLTELLVGHAARLRWVSVQELGAEMWQVGTTSASTAGDATLSTMAVALGGSYARLRIDATITAKGGHNELMAVYFGEGSQMHDFRTMQHHVAPRTTSDLLFKGAVEDHAKSVYSGLIRISKDGRGTSANQTNRNLVLSAHASAESVPNLEIDNNDVKCSHASAIGPIDDDHRYYLESRGVPPEVAERLIVQGFFADLLQRIPDDVLRDQLIDAVRAKFDRRADK